MGTKRFNTLTGRVGMAVTGVAGPDGASGQGIIDYTCLVDGQGNELFPTGNASFWQYAAPAGGLAPITTNTVLKASAGAGVRNIIDSIQVAHQALGAATDLIILDGATPVMRIPLQIAATEGIVVPLYGKLRGSAATAFNYTFSAATTGGVYVNAQGHTET